MCSNAVWHPASALVKTSIQCSDPFGLPLHVRPLASRNGKKQGAALVFSGVRLRLRNFQGTFDSVGDMD